MINFDDFDVEERQQRNTYLSDKEFVMFLTRHKAYYKFIDNLIREKNYPNGYYGKTWFSLETFCKDIVDTRTIGRLGYIDSFYWEDSPEGNDYWERLDGKWYKKCN